jgi:hypothetical protein
MAKQHTILILAVALGACRGEFDSGTIGTDTDTETDGGTVSGTETSDGTTGDGDGDGDTGSTEETATGTPAPTVPMYGNCDVDEECIDPATRCILDDLGRGHCTHDCGGPLDCPLPDTGTSSATCLFDVCFVYCGAEGDLECPDGMVCGMSTWVGNPLSNVCIWP